MADLFVDPDVAVPGDGSTWENAFDTLKDAEALDKDITAAGENTSYIIHCRSGSGSADAFGTVQLLWNSWTTDATHTINVLVAAANRHNLTRSSGYHITCNDNFQSTVEVEISFIFFNGLAINAIHANSLDGFHMKAEDIACYNCLAHDCSDHGFHAAEQVDRIKFINCTAYSCGENGFRGGEITADDHLFANCVAINCDVGFFCLDGPSARLLQMHNCYAGGNANGDYVEEGANSQITNDYCMSEDVTASGTAADDFLGSNNTDNIALATGSGTYFINITATSEDTNLGNDSSALREAGNDLDGNPWWPTDLESGGDGLDYTDAVRSAIWDIGPHEFIVVAGGIAILRRRREES